MPKHNPSYMKCPLLLPFALLFCGCQSETSLQLWIQNQTDDTLRVDVVRRNIDHLPERQLEIPPGWTTSLGHWDERGICDDCSHFMNPLPWIDTLVLTSHSWVESDFPQGDWDFRMHEGTRYRQFHHTLKVTEYDIE